MGKWKRLRGEFNKMHQDAELFEPGDARALFEPGDARAPGGMETELQLYPLSLRGSGSSLVSAI